MPDIAFALPSYHNYLSKNHPWSDVNGDKLANQKHPRTLSWSDLIWWPLNSRAIDLFQLACFCMSFWLAVRLILDWYFWNAVNITRFVYGDNKTWRIHSSWLHEQPLLRGWMTSGIGACIKKQDANYYWHGYQDVCFRVQAYINEDPKLRDNYP